MFLAQPIQGDRFLLKYKFWEKLKQSLVYLQGWLKLSAKKMKKEMEVIEHFDMMSDFMYDTVTRYMQHLMDLYENEH